MEEQEQKAHEDERGAQPPADEGRDKAPQEGGEGEPEEDPVSSPGPAGNPASDEEALSHRQQEQDPPAQD
jgi:hypothetical protein